MSTADWRNGGKSETREADPDECSSFRRWPLYWLLLPNASKWLARVFAVGIEDCYSLKGYLLYANTVAQGLSRSTHIELHEHLA